ncbi:MAG: hypothetical protein EOP86_21045 [Verrucomicrobiaceae bacterium]|nr:MAG: hypothetical protein EOP86_21045 [Verrucomicrobiaceae bacterium]
MPALTAYSNTENTALVVLKQKGYQLWYEEATESYFAEKNGWDFSAESAMELLGAVAVFEHFSPEAFESYWWRKESPELLHNLPSSPNPYSSITRYKRPDDFPGENA